MRTLIKAVPILPAEVKAIEDSRNAMATAHGAYELSRKRYYAAMEALLSKYDQNYKINRANQANVYTGQIQDGILVISLE